MYFTKSVNTCSEQLSLCTLYSVTVIDNVSVSWRLNNYGMQSFSKALCLEKLTTTIDSHSLVQPVNKLHFSSLCKFGTWRCMLGRTLLIGYFAYLCVMILYLKSQTAHYVFLHVMIFYQTCNNNCVANLRCTLKLWFLNNSKYWKLITRTGS